MGLAVLVECREHDWQDDGCVVADEGHDVLIVPVVQRPLSNLCILGFYSGMLMTMSMLKQASSKSWLSSKLWLLEFEIVVRRKGCENFK